jgi:hypothetical protein
MDRSPNLLGLRTDTFVIYFVLDKDGRLTV